MTLAEIIAGIDARLPKWRAWFPSEDSMVEIPRRDLLLLVEAARPKAAPKPLPPAADPLGPGWVALADTAARLKVRRGDVVAVRTDVDGVREYVVRHEPWQTYGGQWLVGLNGIAGGYDLNRVVARKEG